MKSSMWNIPRRLSKKPKFIMSLDQQSKVLYSLILLYVQVEGNRNILKLRYRPLAFTSYKVFALQITKVVSLPQFLHDFWRKIFLTLMLYWPNFIVFWLFLLLEISGNTCIVIPCYPGYDVTNFEIKLSFLIRPFSYMTENVRIKI